MSALGFLLVWLAIGNPDYLLDVRLSSDDTNEALTSLIFHVQLLRNSGVFDGKTLKN